MSNVTNLFQNDEELEAYELHLRNQLKLISSIKLSQLRLLNLPTSEHYNRLGSQAELKKDIELEAEVLKNLKTKLAEMMERGIPC